MPPKDAEGIANSVDPDQTAPPGAVWAGSALFAQSYLSENLGKLRYNTFDHLSLFSSSSRKILIQGKCVNEYENHTDQKIRQPL